MASALRTMVSGEERITKFKEGDEQYEVRVRVLERDRGNADSIFQLMIPFGLEFTEDPIEENC